MDIEGVDNFNGYEIYLLDTRLNKLYNLKEKNEIELTFAHQINAMKLFIGESKFVEDKKKVLHPLTYELCQNYPNPFNPTTIIRFSLPDKERVTLSIYSILGEVVKTIINNEEYQPGTYEVGLNFNKMSSGVYFYRIQSKNFVKIMKMIYSANWFMKSKTKIHNKLKCRGN